MIKFCEVHIADEAYSLMYIYSLHLWEEVCKKMLNLALNHIVKDNEYP